MAQSVGVRDSSASTGEQYGPYRAKLIYLYYWLWVALQLSWVHVSLTTQLILSLDIIRKVTSDEWLILIIEKKKKQTYQRTKIHIHLWYGYVFSTKHFYYWFAQSILLLRSLSVRLEVELWLVLYFPNDTTCIFKGKSEPLPWFNKVDSRVKYLHFFCSVLFLIQRLKHNEQFLLLLFIGRAFLKISSYT